MHYLVGFLVYSCAEPGAGVHVSHFNSGYSFIGTSCLKKIRLKKILSLLWICRRVDDGHWLGCHRPLGKIKGQVHCLESQIIQILPSTTQSSKRVL